MRVRQCTRKNNATIIYDDGDVSICGGTVEHFLRARSLDMLLRGFLVYYQVFIYRVLRIVGLYRRNDAARDNQSSEYIFALKTSKWKLFNDIQLRM